jgi:hypothetical protein
MNCNLIKAIEEKEFYNTKRKKRGVDELHLSSSLLTTTTIVHEPTHNGGNYRARS